MSSCAGRVHSDDAGYRGCRRGDLVSVPRRGLGTVGQVGRSRNAQTADKRASGDYVTLGGRKSAPLLLLSPTTDTATTAIAISLFPSTTSHLHQRSSSPHLSRGLFTNKSSHLSKRLLRSRTRAWAPPPGSTWPNGRMVRSVERQCRCSWWNSPSRLHCAKLQGARKRRPKKTTAASERVLKKLSNSPPRSPLPSSRRV